MPNAKTKYDVNEDLKMTSYWPKLTTNYLKNNSISLSELHEYTAFQLNRTSGIRDIYFDLLLISNHFS